MPKHFTYCVFTLTLSSHYDMRLYVVCVVALIAVAVHAESSEKGKRRAQNYATAAYTAQPAASTATPAPVYATAATSAPAYATKIAPKLNYVPQPVSYEQQQITVQQPVKIAYSAQPLQTKVSQAAYNPQQQFRYSFEAQPELKYAQPQAVKYVSQPAVKYVSQPAVKYVAQPEVKYVTAQPELKYLLAQPQQDVKYAYPQQAALRIVSAPVPSPALTKVAYQAAGPVQAQPVTYAQPISSQPHYSPASSVSSFSFSSPHVTYSNLGLLSQVVGKGYSGQHQPAAPQQVVYQSAPAPASAQYVPAAHATQQVQYVSTPHVQLPQGAQSTQQYVYATPQGYVAPKANYATPGVVYA